MLPTNWFVLRYCILPYVLIGTKRNVTFSFCDDRELYSNNITGPIPSDLGNLTMLVSLDLYLNRFTGPIPATMGKLTKLRFLCVKLSLTSYYACEFVNLGSLYILSRTTRGILLSCPEFSK